MKYIPETKKQECKIFFTNGIENSMIAVLSSISTNSITYLNQKSTAAEGMLMTEKISSLQVGNMNNQKPSSIRVVATEEELTGQCNLVTFSHTLRSSV